MEPKSCDELRDAGKERARAARADALDKAKKIAVAYALGKPDRLCNIDIVQEELLLFGVNPSDLGNAAGSVFDGERWEHSSFTTSIRPSNHSRIIRQWRLVK